MPQSSNPLAGKTPFFGQCKGCDHTFIIAHLPMEATLFAALTRAVRCPSCGVDARSIVVPAPPHAAP